MKKLILTITAGFLITGTCVWLAGCKKEANQVAKINSQNECAQSEADKQVEQRILQFKDGLKNGRIQGNMDISEALWLAEATINYTYADNRPAIKNRKLDSLKISLANIDPTNANALYALALNTLSQHFYGNNYYNSKQLTFADLEIITSNSKDGESELVILYESGDTDGIEPGTIVFDSTDWWMYGFEMGKCHGFIDTTFIMDAAKMLDYKIHNYTNSFAFIPGPGCRAYWTNQTTANYYAYDYPNPNDTAPHDNYYDYLMYYSSFSVNQNTHHSCISPTEMNFYYYGTYLTIYQIVNYDMKNLLSYQVKEYSSKSDIYGHMLQLTKGDYHLSCNGIIIEDLPQ